MTPRMHVARSYYSSVARALFPALVLFVLCSGRASAETETARQHPDERLGALVGEFIAVVNRGEPAELLQFSRERYGEEMLRDMPPDAWATFLGNIHDGKSPIELCCFKLSERIPPNMAVAVLHDTRGDTWSSLQIRFDAADKITSLMIVPTKPPMEFVELNRIDDAGLARELDASLSELAANDKFSGTVLIARNGKPLFSKAFGLANREHRAENRIDTRFSLGSMNKMFTAVAIAQLVERGKLSFDDPIGKHLPAGWISPEVGDVVRVRQLLNHTSGLGDYLEPLLESPLYKFTSLEDYKTIVAAETPAFEPGSQWAYSNTGFLLLGVIVAEVSGVDYYDYIRDNIYRPAGMTDSDHYDVTRVTANLATGYWMDQGQWRDSTLMRTPRGTSAGGGYSTVGDLLAFDVALRSNKLLSETMRERLFTPDADRNSARYGYGFMVHSLPPDHEVGHGGSYYGVSAMLSMFLDSGYTFVALCNGPGAQLAYMKTLALIERAK